MDLDNNRYRWQFYMQIYLSTAIMYTAKPISFYIRIKTRSWISISLFSLYYLWLFCEYGEYSKPVSVGNQSHIYLEITKLEYSILSKPITQ
jgi:hypothetical protein